jgi:hypothetical protein
MFDKKVTRKELESILEELNKEVIFYDYYDIPPSVYTINYNKEGISKEVMEIYYKNCKEQSEKIKLLLDYLKLEIFEGKEIRKIK